MGPIPHHIPDQQSGKQVIRRGRPSNSPALMLAAANGLFAASDLPGNVTMDAIAAAAGVGKGTLFRAFGNRDGLLDILWAAKITVLRDGVESGVPPFEATAPAQERLVAFLDAILTFKLENRHLIRAREFGTGLLQSPHYKWMHAQAVAFVENATGPLMAGEALYTAHALLAALHIDLIEDMLAHGLCLQEIRMAQAARVRAMVGGVRR